MLVAYCATSASKSMETLGLTARIWKINALLVCSKASSVIPKCLSKELTLRTSPAIASADAVLSAMLMVKETPGVSAFRNSAYLRMLVTNIFSPSTGATSTRSLMILFCLSARTVALI